MHKTCAQRFWNEFYNFLSEAAYLQAEKTSKPWRAWLFMSSIKYQSRLLSTFNEVSKLNWRPWTKIIVITWYQISAQIFKLQNKYLIWLILLQFTKNIASRSELSRIYIIKWLANSYLPSLRSKELRWWLTCYCTKTDNPLCAEAATEKFVPVMLLGVQETRSDPDQ